MLAPVVDAADVVCAPVARVLESVVVRLTDVTKEHTLQGRGLVLNFGVSKCSDTGKDDNDDQ